MWVIYFYAEKNIQSNVEKINDTLVVQSRWRKTCVIFENPSLKTVLTDKSKISPQIDTFGLSCKIF